MNQRQLKRSKLLVDVIANKVLQKHKKVLANSCITKTACGTMGCVWGDFVIAMRGVNLKELNKDLLAGGDAGSFDGFANYISNPTLRELTDSLDYGGVDDKFAEYFGVQFGVRFEPWALFGPQSYGTWLQRYKLFVKLLQKQDIIYDPLGKVVR